MMKTSRDERGGFTLMEMMIALVVGAMLMTSLVGISSSVQRTFGRSGEITELQANMRFAMKTLVQDISRSAFMYSPDLGQDQCHLTGQPIPGAPPAMQYTEAADLVQLRLMGNFASTRDYLLNLAIEPYQVVCRNQMPWAPGNPCSADPLAVGNDRHERYLRPFGDGPGIEDLFPLGSWARIEVDNRRYAYYQVNSVNPGTNSIGFTNVLDRNAIRGNFRWVSPVSTLEWQLRPDVGYVPQFGAQSDDNSRWVLARLFLDADGNELRNVEVADFLLPQQRGGLEFQVIQDSTGALCTRAAIPALQAPAAMTTVDPVQARAVRVTLRGRTESENPEFIVGDYGGSQPAIFNIALDLDGDPDNGLAPVVTESTVVNLRNLSLNHNI